MKHTIYRILPLLAMIALFSSCESSTSTVDPVAQSTVSKPSLFILSEGTKNNARLDVYEIGKDTILSNIIPNLGNLGNDVQLINGKLFVVTTLSNKILVIDPASGKKVDSISYDVALSQPTRMVQVSATQAWVTQFHSNFLSVISVSGAASQVGTVPIGAPTQSIAMMKGKVYVTAGSDSLVVMDPATSTISNAVRLGGHIDRVLADSTNNHLIVTGFSANYDSMYVALTDPTGGILMRIVAPGSPGIFIGKGALSIINGSVVTMLNLATGAPMGAHDFGTAYNTGMYDATLNEYFLATAKDYVSDDKVDIYDGTTFALKRSIPTGILPAHFAFYR